MSNHRKWTTQQRKAMSVKLRQKWAVRKSQPVVEPKFIFALIDGKVRQLTMRNILTAVSNDN